MNKSVAFRYSHRVRDSILAILSGFLFCGFTEKASAQNPGESGQSLFQKVWQYDSYRDPLVANVARTDPREVGDGLGPMHNATSCADCHAAGGGADVDRNVTMITLDPRSEILSDHVKEGEARRQILELFPGVLSEVGVLTLDSVVHEASTRPGYDKIRQRLSDFVPGGIPSQWFDRTKRDSSALATAPVLAGRYKGIDFYLSQRNSPPLYGLGLIDQIPHQELKKLEQIQPRQSYGRISGRTGMGKFGWRAQTASLAGFVSAACAGELGLEQSGISQPNDPADWEYINPGTDISDQQCDQLTQYVASLPKPIERIPPRHETSNVREGKRLFLKLGCAICHVKDVGPATGIYSDLLLHDMGHELQAPSPAPVRLQKNERMLVRSLRPEMPAFSSRSVSSYYGTPTNMYPYPEKIASPETPTFPRGGTPLVEVRAEVRAGSSQKTSNVASDTWDELQREWRTPPLWGVASSGPYLHDGRARTLDEAIRWHGGEAAHARQQYEQIHPNRRGKLIAFLSTLVAPEADSP